MFPAPPGSRSHLRLQSLGWALLAGGGAASLALPLGLEASLRSGGCGFFYGLLAFHLQRVDPDDSHLQAGLVGAVCGIRSLGAALPLEPGLVELFRPGGGGSGGGVLPSLMMELIRGWLPLWLPLVGSALLLRGAQRLLPALRP
ncbi:MAG: hypothetical protein VKJ66_05060 [Synechococcus sp.]|nr:hypothetical protein [Synechococcus sp.]